MIRIRARFVRFGLVAALWLAGGVQAAPPAKRVLVLFSHHRLNPTNLAFHQAFQSRLDERFPGQVEQDTETLDITGVHGPLYENKLVLFLKDKYASRPPDAIVAVTPVSWNFAQIHRKDFFPNVPLVGCLVRPEDMAGSADPSVISSFNHKPNLDAMLRLMPRLRTVYIAGGDRSSLENSFCNCSRGTRGRGSGDRPTNPGHSASLPQVSKTAGRSCQGSAMTRGERVWRRGARQTT